MIRRLVLLSLAFALTAHRADAAPSALVPPALRQALSAPAFAGQGIGVYAVTLPDGAPLAAWNPDLPLVPASTMKVLTAACALEALGPAFTYRTRFLTDFPPDRTGTVHGSIYLQGSGDPTFRPEDLWAALGDLTAAGVRRVTGDVVLDDSLFEEPGRPASWPAPHPFPAPYDAPQGALSLAWNSTEIVVTAAGRAGQPATAETSPIRRIVPIASSVVTGKRTAIVLARDEMAGAPAALRLTGTIERGKTFREWIHLGQPTDAVRAGLLQLLPNAGIEVAGAVRRGRTSPAAIVLVERRSLPLADVLVPIMKHSSNFGAELVLRTISTAAGKRPGTTADGVARVLACLDRQGIPHAGINVLDGSGYGRGNRLTARVLVGVVAAARRAPWGEAFRDALPIASEDGSMQRRLRDLRGQVRAKTGTLDDVAALTGYATSAGGREIAFAIMVNRQRRGVVLGHPSVDRILRALLAAADGTSLPAEKAAPARGRKGRTKSK